MAAGLLGEPGVDLSQLGDGPVHEPFDRPHGAVDDLSDLLLGIPLDVLEDNGDAVSRIERVESLANERCASYGVCR
jgi:hypothetical protein